MTDSHVDDLRKILGPCDCHESYTSRGKIDPGCNYCWNEYAVREVLVARTTLLSAAKALVKYVDDRVLDDLNDGVIKVRCSTLADMVQEGHRPGGTQGDAVTTPKTFEEWLAAYVQKYGYTPCDAPEEAWDAALASVKPALEAADALAWAVTMAWNAIPELERTAINSNLNAYRALKGKQ